MFGVLFDLFDLFALFLLFVFFIRLRAWTSHGPNGICVYNFLSKYLTKLLCCIPFNSSYTAMQKV